MRLVVMSYLDLPFDTADQQDQQDEGDSGQNISNLLQAGLLAGSLLSRHGVSKSTAKEAKKASKVSKKKGAKKEKGVPKKALPESRPPSIMSVDSRRSSTAPLFQNVPLQDYTYSTKTKGAGIAKIKAAVRKAEKVGKKVKEVGKSYLEKQGLKVTGIQTKVKAMKQGAQQSAGRFGAQAQTMAAVAGTKAKQLASAGMRKVTESAAAARKALQEYPSTYRAVKERLGLDRPGTFQEELQNKLRGETIMRKSKKGKVPAVGEKTLKQALSGFSAKAVPTPKIKASDIRRVPKSEGVFMPGLSREFNKLKKKPTIPKTMKLKSGSNPSLNLKGVKASRRMSKP